MLQSQKRRLRHLVRLQFKTEPKSAYVKTAEQSDLLFQYYNKGVTDFEMLIVKTDKFVLNY